MPTWQVSRISVYISIPCEKTVKQKSPLNEEQALDTHYAKRVCLSVRSLRAAMMMVMMLLLSEPPRGRAGRTGKDFRARHRNELPHVVHYKAS